MIVGYLSDKLNSRWGKRNIWYFFGTVLVVPSFLCIFMRPDFFTTEAGRNAWYMTWYAICNVGWASVRIAHLTIVNNLSFS